MQILYFLEDIRTPMLDTAAAWITHFGEETIFMILSLFVFWCVDKYEGYYLLTMGFIGTTINQLIKIICRIPRPWVLDKNFTIVESARAQATGYSFPSGHTQSAVSVFGGLARCNKNRLIRGISIILCVLVPMSRMYLGVHTPKDVGTSFVIALVLVFATYPLIRAAKENHRVMWIYLLILLIITVFGLIFVYCAPFPENIDSDNLLSARDNLAKLLGAMGGFLVVFYLDVKYTKFETKASVKGQIVKMTAGIAMVLLIQKGLKVVFLMSLGDVMIADVLRYFLMVVTAGGLWPMSFKRLSKI